MRLSAPLLTLAGTVAGTAAAVVAYQATAAAPDARPASVTEDPAPQSTTSWLPCDRGWKVEGTTCVRIKEKVVVVNDLPAPAAAPARTAGVRSTSHDSVGDDDQAENEVEHADENEVENESDDDSRDEADHQSEDTPDPEDVGHDD